MYLKSLDIQGFKSFPDKISLRFGDDITAIVGPNGSGKSNISDAIRWVMGEQSTRALRGNKMEDVIFGGTQKRPQLGFAEASLIFDNADRYFPVDSDEVMITRRYYRSGENEFYLNKQSVRLKDVNELFMDTGLGREGYSNISQGRIDEILAVKSTDRREVFEEAAGISKYRHRKEETERRLERTEENLTRIQDKISELELQVEPLREQSEKAKKYLEYQSELKGQEVAVWLQTLVRLDAAAKKAAEDYASSRFVLSREHDNLEALYRKSEALNQSLRDRDVGIENQRARIEAEDTLRQELSARQTVLETDRRNAEQNLEQLRRELDEQAQRTGGVHSQMDEGRNRLSDIDRRSAETEALIAARESDLKKLTDSAEGLNRSYLELRGLYGSAAAELAARTADHAALLAASEQSRDRMTELRADADSAAERRQSAEADLEACAKALSEAREAVRSLSNAAAGYELRRKTRAAKAEELLEQNRSLGVELETAASKRNMLREMEREYEGFSKAVRFVMQQAESGELRNVHGPVSRLISVEDRIAVAVEIALGAAMQNIVVSTEQDGKYAIQQLKNRDAGRATFLPLSAIRGRTLNEPGLEDCPGFVGIASELVQCRSEYRPIVENLLGRTVIAERLDDAIAISRRYRGAFKIVTLDGQVMNAGGSMTGGSVSKNAGVLSRANEIERLTKTVQVLQEKRRALSAELTEANRQRDLADYELETARAGLREQEDAVLRLEGEEKQHRVLCDAIREAGEANRREISALEQRLGADAKRLEALERTMDGLKTRQAELQEKMDALSGDQTEASRQGSAVSDELTALRISLAGLAAERQSVEENLRRLDALAADLEGDHGQKQLRLTELQAELSRLDERISENAAQTAAQTERTDELRAELRDLISARTETEAERTASDRDAQQKNKDILDLERETARLEAKKNTAELEQKQIIDKLWDSYELTPSTAPAQAAEIESLTAANRRIAELRRKLHGLGTPNLGAIDEYERVSERYLYLTGQRDDVLQSKKELESIIRDVTRRMTEIFTEEFAKINHYFSETFVEMFHGGKAALELEDPNEPLACGIEIKVQPPGKQLKTITLLSGGEKAFVAIALYFAILKVRPTPFCMLDEIDAALDDRNVERFSEYLRQLCRKTQFIVITHRRGTMEASDALFGVTMQEQGVSKILRLDLNSVEKELGITT